MPMHQIAYAIRRTGLERNMTFRTDAIYARPSSMLLYRKECWGRSSDSKQTVTLDNLP